MLALPLYAVAALAVRGQFTLLNLGAGMVRSVGQNQALWRGVSAVPVVALPGSAVALAGAAIWRG